MKIILLSATLTCSTFLSFAQDTLIWKTKVRFPSNSSTLQPEHPAILQTVCDSLPKFEYYTIYLSGHSDSDAGNDYNRILSEKRMLSVKEVLEKCVLENTRIHYTYYGEEQPIADNKTAAGKALNRRTEIEIRYLNPNSAEAIKRRNAKNAALVQTSPVSVPPVVKERIFTAPTGLGVKAQCFTIDNFKDTMLVSKAGAVYIIPAKALNTQTRYVEYCIKEATKPSEMILEGLTTTSNDKLLQSAGMWKIEANDNGKALQLAPNKFITVAMPSKQPLDSDMKLWDAEHTADGGVNWVSPQTIFSDFECCMMRRGDKCEDEPPILYFTKAQQDKVKFLKNDSLELIALQKIIEENKHSKLNKLTKRLCENNFRFFGRWKRMRIQKKIKELQKRTTVFPAMVSTSLLPPQCLSDLSIFGINSTEELQKLMLEYNCKTLDKLYDILYNKKVAELKQQLKLENKLSEANLNFYICNVAITGAWINIDKYLKLPKEQLSPVLAKTNTKGNLKTFIFIKEMKGNYPLYKTDENLYSLGKAGIPKNEPIWIVSIGQSEGQFYLGMAETKASDKVFDLEMKPCKNAEELEQRLSVMD